MAFFPRTHCGIPSYVERKYKSYIAEWRKKRGLTQAQVLDRLREMAGDPKPNDKALNIPTTGASLSRIETGIQNFNMATLAALAEILEVDEPGWLLTRNPFKAGEVVDLSDFRLNAEEAKRAREVLRAMFPDATTA